VRGPSWGPGQGIDRLRACRRDDTGAAAVEFALVALLLFSLFLGIIEVTLLLRDNVSVSSAVRTGARIASAEAGEGPGTCPAGNTTCVPASVPKLAQDAANSIQKAGTAMPQDAIDAIWVYQANANGWPGGGTKLSDSSCTAANNCVILTWNKNANKFEYASGGGISTSIAACAGTNSNGTPKSDSVGVLMKATHKFLFGLFGTTLSMSDRAVMQFEPLSTDTCQANKPIGGGGHK